MKKIIFLLAICMATTTATNAATTTSINAPAEIKKVTLVASGLTCSMCSKAIFKALTKLDFVAEVKVDIESSKYILTFKSGKKVLIDQIKAAVKDAGFGVQSLVYE